MAVPWLDVAYLFHVNGRYVSNNIAVRDELADLHKKYGYFAKIELMTDAILRHRTDGALVRFVVPINDAGVASAETQMKSFIAQARPLLGPYLPD